MQMIINDNLHTKKLNEEQSQTEKFKKKLSSKGKGTNQHSSSLFDQRL